MESIGIEQIHLDSYIIYSHKMSYFLVTLRKKLIKRPTSQIIQYHRLIKLLLYYVIALFILYLFINHSFFFFLIMNLNIISTPERFKRANQTR